MTEETPGSAPGIGTPMSERMQALLSRAVEDQLSEQRQLAGALAEVRAQLGRLSEELTALRAAPRGDDAAIEQRIGGISAEVREAVRQLSERLDGVSRLVADRSGDQVDLRTTLSELDTEVKSQAAQLSSVATGLQDVASYSERLAALERSIAQIGPMLGEVGESSLEHANGLGELQTRFDAVARAVQDVAQRLTDREMAGGDNAALQQQLQTLQDDVTALGGEVAGLVENGVDRTTLQAAIDAAQSAVERAGRVDDIASQVSDLRLHLSGPQGVAANVEQLRAELGAVSGLVDSAELDGRVREIVAVAVQSSEQRLTAHVDEAVLALAEALLRRRYPRGEDAAAVAAAAAASYADDFDEMDEAEEVSVGQSVLDDLEADRSTDPDPDAEEQPVTFIKSERNEPATLSPGTGAWAQRSPSPDAPPQADPETDSTEDRSKRRRGWFRSD